MNKLIQLLTILNFERMGKIEDETMYFLPNKEKNIRITTRDNRNVIQLVIYYNNQSRVRKESFSYAACIEYLSINYSKQIRQHKINNIIQPSYNT